MLTPGLQGGHAALLKPPGCVLLTSRTLDPIHLIHTVLPTGEQPIFFALGSEGGGAAAVAGQLGEQSKGAKLCVVLRSSRLCDLDKFLSLRAMFSHLYDGNKKNSSFLLALGRIKRSDVSGSDT